VIAKSAPRDTLDRERTAYTEILPSLGTISFARYLGYAAPADDAPWIFLEDLGAPVGRDLAECRRQELGRLVGLLHRSGTHLLSDTYQLPRRTVSHYLDVTRSAMSRLSSECRDPSFTSFERRLLNDLATLLHRVWDTREHALDWSSNAPPTLLHGDLALKHLRTRGSDLALIDWEEIGFGCPAVDLFAIDHLGPDARSAYAETVLGAWDVDEYTIDHLFHLAGMLRTIQSIDWELLRVASPLLESSIARFQFYSDKLTFYLECVPA
jgi:hypothetical protein